MWHGSTNSGFFCSAPASSDSCSWASTGLPFLARCHRNRHTANTLHYQAQLVYLPLLLALITELPEEEGLPLGGACLENLQLGHQHYQQVQVGGGANSEGLATSRCLFGQFYGDQRRR